MTGFPEEMIFYEEKKTDEILLTSVSAW